MTSSFYELTNTQTFPAPALEQRYFHPTPKPSASTRKINFDMCTECLGSENGASICESLDELFLLLEENEKKPRPARLASSNCRNIKKSNGTGTFPPPLSSISGCDGIKVKPRREGGRLIITAATACSPFFHTERADGRLRMSLRKAEDYCCYNNNNNNNNNEDVEDEEDEVEEKVEGEETTDVAAGSDEVVPIGKPVAAMAAGSRCMESEQSSEMQSWTGQQPYCYVAIS
ncbi:unnamed protein product [Cuscuta epithymum]|uniref:FAF domain-containing protein n=1 Tax=Cuscuta epithymum TaxID=186058 RepID=A0AAV0FB07_9ASTE|nr:unnamed protein product [Cuscuta epithymum]